MTPSNPRLPSRARLGLVTLLVLAALAAAACGGNAAETVAEFPDLGDLGSGQGIASEDAAPGFTVATMDGNGFSFATHLSDDGRPVFLNLWASWCPPCKAEMPGIDAAAAANEEVKFVGVAIQDDPADSAEFAASIGIRYTIGFDEQNTVSNGYSPVGLPASYIISADGEILERIYGSVTEDEINEKIEGWFGT
jgi:thiol-disulfide isomerase/thioredoxin